MIEHLSFQGLMHMLLFLFFDTNNTWGGMGCKDQLHIREVIARTIEAIIILFQKLRLKMTIILLKANDIKSWLGPFTKALSFKCTQNFDFVSLYLQCSVDDFKMQDMCIYIS